jgi:hypothetical protein
MGRAAEVVAYLHRPHEQMELPQWPKSMISAEA